ncbi:MAG: type III pantothenate kinase [Planctomycetota bacterium]|jgi:pantothenate kinase type III
MILVDIGNSGLRACKSNCDHRVDYNTAKIFGPVVKLSWSSIGQKISKHRPAPTESENRRWTHIDDASGYDWLVQQVTSQVHPVDGVIWRIGSVNRKALEHLVTAIEKNAKFAPRETPIIYQIVNHRLVGIESDVDYPEKVGIDRLLAARAANAWNDSRCKIEMRSERSPVIVVQAGTALTVDWVDAHGRFQGGSILPGAGLALQYLAAGTDQLPWLPTDSIDRLPRLPGKNTEEAIAAGVHASLVGGVRYLVERYRREIGGSSQIPVVISGGDGRLVLEHIATPATYVENLVLLGLALCDPL